jgi:hypothetical protein
MELNPIVAALSRLHDRNTCLVERINAHYRVDEIEHSMRQAHDVLRRSTEWSRACHDENRPEPLPPTVTHAEATWAGQRLLVLVGLRFQAQLLAMRDANAQLGEASPYWDDPIWRLHGHHADEREYNQFWRRLPGDYVPPVRKPRNRQSAARAKAEARGPIEASRENAKARKPGPTGPGVGDATQGSEIQETCSAHATTPSEMRPLQLRDLKPGPTGPGVSNATPGSGILETRTAHGAAPSKLRMLPRSRLRDYRTHPALSGQACTSGSLPGGNRFTTGSGGACLRAA